MQTQTEPLAPEKSWYEKHLDSTASLMTLIVLCTLILLPMQYFGGLKDIVWGNLAGVFLTFLAGCGVVGYSRFFHKILSSLCCLALCICMVVVNVPPAFGAGAGSSAREALFWVWMAGAAASIVVLIRYILFNSTWTEDGFHRMKQARSDHRIEMTRLQHEIEARSQQNLLFQFETDWDKVLTSRWKERAKKWVGLGKTLLVDLAAVAITGCIIVPYFYFPTQYSAKADAKASFTLAGWLEGVSIMCKQYDIADAKTKDAQETGSQGQQPSDQQPQTDMPVSKNAYFSALIRYTITYISVLAILILAAAVTLSVSRVAFIRFIEGIINSDTNFSLDFLSQYSMPIGILGVAVAFLFFYSGYASKNIIVGICQSALISVICIVLLLFFIELTRLAINQSIRKDSLLRRSIRYTYILLIYQCSEIVTALLSENIIPQALNTLLGHSEKHQTSEVISLIRRMLDEAIIKEAYRFHYETSGTVVKQSKKPKKDDKTPDQDIEMNTEYRVRGDK